MTAMNADSKKPNVAAAQLYFVGIIETLIGYSIEHAESMDRFAIREEISEREIVLSKTAAAAGANRFDYFRSAGYRGMYDMPYQELRELRGVAGTKRSVLDFMGKDELAGNLSD
jgi:DNA-damage-inducible protein D